MNAEAMLRGKFPADLVTELLKAYREIESNYVLQKWKPAELDAGHFVEAARRILEAELTPPYTPLNKQLAWFNDVALKKLESAAGDDSYRMLIPRVLFAVNGIRNKRGVGHLGPISANEMDATLILYNVKWVLAELVRLASGASPDDTQAAIDQIVERELSLLWKHDDLAVVLDPDMETRDQVLIHLYDKSPQGQADLQEATEYKHVTNFRKILARLHESRLIHRASDGTCRILPPGVQRAEALVRDFAAKQTA